jgi:hypothetical protein
MKRLLLGVVAGLVLTTAAQADTIGTIDIEIPDSWELLQSSVDGELYSYYYTADSEIIALFCHDITFLSDDMRLVGDTYLIDCDSAFGDMDGYYLMQNAEDKTTGSRSLFQQCVYKNEDEWYHAISVSSNFTDYVFSMVYQAQMDGPQAHIGEFIDIMKEQFGGE